MFVKCLRVMFLFAALWRGPTKAEPLSLVTVPTTTEGMVSRTSNTTASSGGSSSIHTEQSTKDNGSTESTAVKPSFTTHSEASTGTTTGRVSSTGADDSRVTATRDTMTNGVATSTATPWTTPPSNTVGTTNTTSMPPPDQTVTTSTTIANDSSLTTAQSNNDTTLITTTPQHTPAAVGSTQTTSTPLPHTSVTSMPMTAQTNDDTTSVSLTTHINPHTASVTQTNSDTTSMPVTTPGSNGATSITPTAGESSATMITSTAQTSNGITSTSTVTPDKVTTVTTNSTQPSPEPPTSTAAHSSLTTQPTSATEMTTAPSGPPPSSPSSTLPSSSTIPPAGSTTIPSPSTPTPGETTAPCDMTTVLPDATTTPNNTSTVTSPPPTEIPSSSTTAPPILAPGPVIVCPSVPCPLESVCLNGTCQCLSGSFLLDGRCTSGQVFPGELHLISLTFEEDMWDRSSRLFLETAAKISAALRGALRKQPGYIRSDVVHLQPGSVRASVNNIFENSTASQESVDQSIRAAIANSSSGLFNNATFTGTSLCEQEPLPCDVLTTTCNDKKGGVVCSCKDGYISTVYSNTSCMACPSGQGVVGKRCQRCPFGYAGFNCSDSSLLAVVVVSCVLGGVLLIIILALLAYSCWRKKSKSEPDSSSSPYSAGDLSKPWPTDITPIPRANTTWDTASSIEMTEGGSTHALVDKKSQTNGVGFQMKQKGWKKSGSYDLNPGGMNTFKGRNPSRYSYLVQGHENPYFLPGDEKKN